jgi:hypothetical protein
MGKMSRRSLLKGGIAGASLAGFSQLFAQTSAQAGVPPGDTVQVIVDLAATTEALACTHYYAALTSDEMQLSPEERRYLSATLDTELFHLLYLITQYNAKTLNYSFYLPENIYTSRAGFGDVTRQMETAFISAYLAGVRRFAEIGAQLIAASFAQIATTEGMHLALIRGFEGLMPNDRSLVEPMYFNVSEVAPVLRPFLEGGRGFTGPFDYPGDQTIRDLVGSNRVTRTDTFTTRYGQNRQ